MGVRPGLIRYSLPCQVIAFPRSDLGDLKWRRHLMRNLSPILVAEGRAPFSLLIEMTLPKSSFTDCFASSVGQACNLFLIFLSIFSWRQQHLLSDFGLKLFDKLQESGVCTLRYYLGLILAIQQRTIPRTILKTKVTFHSNLLKRKITVHNGKEILHYVTH